MMDALQKLFSPDGFMPHGHCYLWQPGILWLHILSDALIAAAYASIPFTLIYFVRKRQDLAFNWMFVCFAVFIIACGATHLMEIWVIWHPTYWMSGTVKAITALASVPTAILLIRLVPAALRVPSPTVLQEANAALAKEVTERKLAEETVRRLNEESEQRVRERTADLEATNRLLTVEIAERRQVEASLRETQERTRAIIDTALDGIITMSHEGRIVEFNPAAEKIFRQQASEVVGRPLAEVIIPPALRTQHDRGLAHYLASGEGPVLGRRIELNGLRADGVEVPLELSITRMPGDGPPLFTGFLRDITERRQAEQAKRESQQMLRAVVDNSSAVVYVKDLEGRYLMVNRRYESIFHLTAAVILGRTDHDLFPKESADAFRAADQQVLAAGTVLEMEELAPQDDGLHTYLSAKCPLFDAAGKPYAVCGISTDITERKQMEAAHAQFAAIIQSSDDAIISKTLEGVINSWNPGAEKLFGYTAEEAIGRPLLMLVPPERVGEEPEILARITRGESVDHFETVRLTKSGERLNISATISPIRDAQGRVVGASKIARDITPQMGSPGTELEFAL